MKRIISTLLIIIAITSAAAAKVDLVTLPTRDTVQLTIYNSADMTLVRESRALTLKEGKNSLQFSWANTLIDPTSLEMLPKASADKIDIAELTYPPRVQNLGLWNIQSGVKGQVPVEISYLTSGLSWRAFYMGTLTEDEKTMRLQGYVRVTNNSGEDYENAQTRLGYAWVIAPFSGFVTKRYFDAGSLVTSNNSVLYTLMGVDSVKIIVSVLEKDVSLVANGRKAVVSVDAYPGREFHGVITRFSGAVDLSTRTMETEIDIPNHDHLLKPGMYANVALILDEHKDALTVPSQALLKDERGSYVFSADNRIAIRKNVNAGIEQNARTEILSGLEGKENIVTIGQQFLKDSSKVIIQQ